MKRSVVASFSLSPETLQQAQDIADVENKSRSEVVGEALKQYYLLRQWEDLRSFGTRQAKKLGIRNEDDVDRLIHEFRRKK